MNAYPGREVGKCTFAVFFSLVAAASKARAIVDGKYDSEMQRSDATARSNREIIISRHFPLFYPEAKLED